LRRREFVTYVGAAAAAWPLAARAQRAKVYRLGILANARGPGPWEGFFRGLRDLGYVDGQNLIVEWRYSEGQGERWPELAGELVGLKVDAIVVFTTPAALAAKQATSTIPIIIPTAIDPVGAGLAASLARPGGNVTGVGLLLPEISAKGLSLLKEAVPGLTRVAVLWNAGNPALAPVWREVEPAAGAMGLVLHSQQVREPQDFAGAFVAIAQQRPEGLLILIDALVNQYLSRIVEWMVRERLPAVSTSRLFAETGALMSYGPSFPDVFRKAAGYVDRVLKGAKPADLPFQQPTEFELVINLKTARALGLTLPPLLLTRADEVIE
jgi:putative tryptophan/tyrosine transport system substrate-binding protein